ncbi:hypothetical protein [Neorhodopirellula pilleata]|nr:hypothetical protein [Neorhodopirellula pilleata]
MTFSHEIGHLIGGWCGGATLTGYSVSPWRLPFSLHNPDPNPMLTLWAGPVLGVTLPILAALLIRQSWCWFVADFCLLANGVYLALAWWAGDRFLDTPRMLAAGVAPISIITFCLATVALGYVRFRADCIHVLAIDAQEPSE